MRVGFVFECQPQGSDEQVYTYVAGKLCDRLEIAQGDISSLGNKRNVMEEGAMHAAVMIDNGCDYVFIVWDRMPAWGGTGRCADHIGEITANLYEEGVDMDRIVLCCIDEMLESWLIADGRGVTNYFQAINHQSPRFPNHRRRADQADPKNRLTRYNGRYNESVDNIGIVKALPDFGRAARYNRSFGEFVAAVERICAEAA